jgi:hypothetical protein
VAVLLRASAYSAKLNIGACDQNTPESLKERKQGIFPAAHASILAKHRIAPNPSIRWKPGFAVAGNESAGNGMGLAKWESERASRPKM